MNRNTQLKYSDFWSIQLWSIHLFNCRMMIIVCIFWCPHCLTDSLSYQQLPYKVTHTNSCILILVDEIHISTYKRYSIFINLNLLHTWECESTNFSPLHAMCSLVVERDRAASVVWVFFRACSTYVMRANCLVIDSLCVGVLSALIIMVMFVIKPLFIIG